MEPHNRPRRTNRVSVGIAQLSLNLGTRSRCVVSITTPAAFTPWKEPVPIVQETEWAPEPVWIGAENRHNGIRSRTFQPVASRCTD